jgi:hypothetical protein
MRRRTFALSPAFSQEREHSAARMSDGMLFPCLFHGILARHQILSSSAPRKPEAGDVWMKQSHTPPILSKFGCLRTGEVLWLPDSIVTEEH